eukprot:gene12807-biopygen3361
MRLMWGHWCSIRAPCMVKPRSVHDFVGASPPLGPLCPSASSPTGRPGRSAPTPWRYIAFGEKVLKCTD